MCYVMYFCFMSCQTVISSVKKNQERGLGPQGGDTGCSCKYGGQGGLHFNTKTFLDQSFKKKKSSKLNFMW